MRRRSKRHSGAWNRSCFVTSEVSAVNVTLYSLEGCPFCEKARTFLQEKNIEFN
ncbi:MAG: glutaredoxin, partial [Deltaproteobacteria bacterium]|nr:glutaredoxin [Deltaproteobacteria bacterium]